jgi:circadian clock protein KaiA
MTNIPNCSLQANYNSLELKFKERLGYLALYFQRSKQQFFSHISPEEKKQVLTKLKQDYYQIILNYFKDEYAANQRIDRFVEQAFLLNIPVDKIMEIHMILMEELIHQLKLEGLQEECVLNYRLVLIDVLAHLCEMYRSALPDNNFA